MEQYHYIKQMECGGMGNVFLVQHKQSSTLWIMKETFQVKEAQILAQLHHPKIPHLHQYYQRSGKVYMLMEYIDGNTLSHRIQDANARKEKIHEKVVLHWMLQVMDIIGYLHENNILYCDMKPENIILAKDGTIHLIDFGTAIEKQCQDRVHYGTIGYAAREQYEEGLLDERVDIYGVAKVMIALLSGVYNAVELEELSLTQLPMSKGLRKILTRSMQADRENRYQSIMAMRSAVEKQMTKNRSILHLFHCFNLRSVLWKYE